MSDKVKSLLDMANHGYVGLNDALEVGVGYDQEVIEWNASVSELCEDADITACEKIELANVMILRWDRYREAALEAERAKGK